MTLRAKKPDGLRGRLKMLVYSDKNVGKTGGAVQFPNNYLIDMELGSNYYDKTLLEKGSVRYQTSSFSDLIEEIRELMVTKHKYRFLTIDPITIAYEDNQDSWLRVFDRYAKSDKEREMKDYGMRYWGKVKFDSRLLRRLLTRLDMGIICTSHQKPQYYKQEVVGVTHDSHNKDGYLFDFVFRLEKRGDKRFAITEKQRGEIGEQIFPDEFEWSYEAFLKYYGKEFIEKDSTPVTLATEEQVKEIKHLISVVNIPSEDVEKWLIKAKVEDWDEMEKDQIAKCIDFVKKKLEPAKEAK